MERKRKLTVRLLTSSVPSLGRSDVGGSVGGGCDDGPCVGRRSDGFTGGDTV